MVTAVTTILVGYCVTRMLYVAAALLGGTWVAPGPAAEARTRSGFVQAGLVFTIIYAIRYATDPTSANAHSITVAACMTVGALFAAMHSGPPLAAAKDVLARSRPNRGPRQIRRPCGGPTAGDPKLPAPPDPR